MDWTWLEACLAHVWEAQQVARCLQKFHCVMRYAILWNVLHQYYQHIVQIQTEQDMQVFRLAQWCFWRFRPSGTYVSLREWFPTLSVIFKDQAVPLKCSKPLTQWHSITIPDQHKSSQTVLSWLTDYSYRNSSCMKLHRKMIQLSQPEYNWAYFLFHFTLLHQTLFHQHKQCGLWHLADLPTSSTIHI